MILPLTLSVPWPITLLYFNHMVDVVNVLISKNSNEIDSRMKAKVGSKILFTIVQSILVTDSIFDGKPRTRVNSAHKLFGLR